MATVQDSKLDLLLTPRVPQGLAAAVEGLTREVIRHRPENIYVFAAHHFEKLLRLREQYGVNTTNKKNIKLIREMNDAIKERCVYLESKETKDFLRNSTWSLNETETETETKIDYKRRIIYKENDKKNNADKIRESANDSVSMSSKIQANNYKKKYETCRGEYKNRIDKYPIARTSKKSDFAQYYSEDSSSVSKSYSKSTPKIISQIPLAKDIKTELKRNRISSRDRKKIEEKKVQISCQCKKEKIFEKTFKKSTEKSRQIYETRSEQKRNAQVEDRTKKKADKIKDKLDTTRTKKFSKAPKMDEIRNYIAQNFAGMTSLDALQTPSYVEKVQEVIDETSKIIKEKVEALKAGIINAAKEKKYKKETVLNRNSSNAEYFNYSTTPDSDSKSIKGHLFKSSSHQNLFKTSESFIIGDENLQSIDNKENSLPQPESLDLSNASNISLPVVRPPSSKSVSGSLSAHSDFDGLVLPPISPESNKSTKITEDLVLPVLSPPRSSSISPDSINCNEKIIDSNSVNIDEEFKDSLNVTPDLVDTTPRPDSLENSENMDKKDCEFEHVSPMETLKDKLLEIEEVQKRIEDVLDDNASAKDGYSKERKKNKEDKVTSEIQDKLLEIQESEKRIEKILDYESTVINESEIFNTDIKSKLKELEETEKRIEGIFIHETDNAYLNKTNIIDTNIEQKDDNSTYENIININDKNIQKDQESKSDNIVNIHENDDDLKTINTALSKTDLALSPYCYVLSEGSPYDIPDFVTTVIIPDRSVSPESDILKVEVEDGEIFSTLISSKEKDVIEMENNLNKVQRESEMTIHDVFGEIVNMTNLETSNVDLDYIRGIRDHSIALMRQDLDLIQEERDKEVDDTENIDSEDEKVLKVVTTSLEEILGKTEYVLKEETQTAIKNNFKKGFSDYLSKDVQVTEYESTEETKETSITDGFVENTEIIENSLDIEETTGISIDSTNEIKDISITTDRSSLSFDPAIPIVPELNLDSLPDLTISSFNITDDEQREEYKNENKNLKSSEVLISSTDLKENNNFNIKDFEEEGTKEDDINENEINRSNIIETTEENSFLELEKMSNELEKKLYVKDTEQSTNEKYEKLDENLISDELGAIISSRTSEKAIIEKENSINDSDDRLQGQNDLLSNASVNSDIKTINVKKTVDVVSDEIANTSNENNQSKKMTMTTSESQNKLLAHHDDNAESSLRELENDPLAIERNCPTEIDTDQNSQFVDSSRVSSQCTKRLDSDNVLMETSTDNTIKNNSSQNTITIQKKQMVTDKTVNDDFQVVCATAINEEEEKEEGEEGEEEKVKNAKLEEKKNCRVYVPEIGTSKEISSSTATSTFMSAATKIQAGVRGFLTRRRLQSSQRRSSTLDSVPSIEESFAAENSSPSTKTVSSSSTSYLMPIVENISFLAESKNRRKLCREDAVQRKTLSFENAFADNQIQHTGEFHDCIPLPIFDFRDFTFKIIKMQEDRNTTNEVNFNGKEDIRKEDSNGTDKESKKCNLQEELVSCKETLSNTKNSNVEQFLDKMLATSTTVLPEVSKLGKLVDVVVLPGDNETMLQSRYLNFITSVEDIGNDSLSDPLLSSNSPRGVIIEEITSLDEDKSKLFESTFDKANDNTVSKDVINKIKMTNESLSLDLQVQSTQEMSNNCTSNISEIIESQYSDLKSEQSIENSANILLTPMEINALDLVSFNESRLVEEISDKNTSSSSQKIDEKAIKEIPDEKGTLSLVDASISITDDLASMDIDEMLRFGDEDDNLQKIKDKVPKPTLMDILKSSSVSQESHSSDDRIRTPLTIMQIVSEKVEETSEKFERSVDEKTMNSSSDGSNELSANANVSLTEKETIDAQEKEQESFNNNSV